MVCNTLHIVERQKHTSGPLLLLPVSPLQGVCFFFKFNSPGQNGSRFRLSSYSFPVCFQKSSLFKSTFNNFSNRQNKNQGEGIIVRK